MPIDLLLSHAICLDLCGRAIVPLDELQEGAGHLSLRAAREAVRHWVRDRGALPSSIGLSDSWTSICGGYIYMLYICYIYIIEVIYNNIYIYVLYMI